MVTKQTTFAQRLQQARETAGLSQYALAKRSGLSKQTLSKLEIGDREPNWMTVQRLAAALGLSCEAFADPGIGKLLPDATADRPRGRPPAATGKRRKKG